MSDNATIRRAPHDTENPFAQISRVMLQDKTLSYEARGLLGYLLSKSGNWEVRVKDLQIVGCGRDKVYRVLGELQAKGYIGGRTKYQDEKGQWHWTPYDVYETRELNPFTEKPYTANPYTENTEIKAVKKNTKDRGTKERTKEKEELSSVAVATTGEPATEWLQGQQEAEDSSMFTPLTGKQKSAQADISAKRLENATATTPPPPAHSPAPAAAKGKRTEKQLANDARIEALRVAMFKGRGKPDIALQGKEISNYASVAKQLIEGGIAQEDFLAYVEYWHKAAQSWPGGLTLNSLVKPGRMIDFKSWYAEEAENKRKRKELEERFYAKHPHMRPSVQSEPVEYMPADEFQRMMDMVLRPANRQENAS